MMQKIKNHFTAEHLLAEGNRGSMAARDFERSPNLSRRSSQAPTIPGKWSPFVYLVLKNQQ